MTEQNYCNIANSETAEVSAAKLWSVADFSSSRHNESWSGAIARSSIRTPAWTAAQIKPQHTQTASSCQITVQMSLITKLAFTSIDKYGQKVTSRCRHIHVRTVVIHPPKSEQKKDQLRYMFQKVTCLTFQMNLRAWSQISPPRHTL